MVDITSPQEGAAQPQPQILDELLRAPEEPNRQESVLSSLVGIKPPAPSESNTLYGTGKAETVLGEFGAGLQSGTRQVISTPVALGGLMAAAMGADETAAKWTEFSRQIAEGGAQRGIAKLEDLTSDPISWVRYIAGVAGTSVPFLLSVLGGAGVGSTLTQLLARRGVDLATRNAILATAPRNAAWGAFGTAAGIETGATSQELHQATGRVEPLASVTAGSMKGALESLFPVMLSRQFGLTIGEAGGLYDRFLSSVVKTETSRAGRAALGFGTEAVTEALQEEIDIQARSYFDTQYSPTSYDAWSRRANAFVAGGIGGGIFSSMTPGDARKHLEDRAILDAVKELPGVYGAENGELSTVSPSYIIRTSASGLDTTAGLVNSTAMDDLLSKTDLRQRGLYAAVVPGRDPTFGTQAQANNDHGYYNGTGFLRLDPNVVQLGDVTASVEDLPSSTNDPRVSFHSADDARTKVGLMSLTAAIDTRNRALAERDTASAEKLLSQAAGFYRSALDNGVRVAPLPDGQLIFRDPQKAQSVAVATTNVEPQLSSARLKGTVWRPGNKGFFLFAPATAMTGEKGPGGRVVDIENLLPGDLTAFPTSELARRVLSSQAVARRLEPGPAKALGITTPNPQVLKDFVNYLSNLPVGKLSAQSTERFMQLVDQGLRLDVSAQTPEFALLREVDPLELKMPPVGEIGVERIGLKISKGQTTRKSPSRVSKRVSFKSKQLSDLFASQLHNSALYKVLVGAGGVLQSTKLLSSPLAVTLRDLANSLKLKVDFVIEVVAPDTMPDAGVRYSTSEIILTEGGKPQKRAVFQINPWFYAKPTEGGKPLTKKYVDLNYATKGALGGTRLVPVNADTSIWGKVKAFYKGREVTLKDIVASEGFQLQSSPTTPVADVAELEVSAKGKHTFVGFTTKEDFEKRQGNALRAGKVRPVVRLQDKDVQQWQKEKGAPEPAIPTAQISKSGKLAQAFGTPDVKMTTDTDRMGEFWADFSFAFGKVLMDYEWGKLSAGEQEQIHLAYQREAQVAASLTNEQRLARVAAHPVLERVLGSRGENEHYYRFEEWVVSHLARSLANVDTHVGVVREFLKKVGKVINTALSMLASRPDWVGKFDPREGRPHEVVEEWVQRLQARGIDELGQEGFLSDSTVAALRKSIADNAAALEGWHMEYVTAFPQRASTAQIRKLLEYMPKDAPEDRAKLEGLLAMADRHNTVLEWTLGLHQLQDLNPHIVGLRDYLSLTRAMENDAVSWATLADERLRAVQQLRRESRQALWNLIYDLDQMSYLDPKALAKKQVSPRWPNEQELMALVRKHKLDADAFAQYVEIRKDFFFFLSYLETVGVRNAEEKITDPKKRAEKIAEIQGEIAQLRSRPYFPHMRFGKYAVTVRDKSRKTLFFATFDTKRERKAASQTIQDEYNVPAVGFMVEDEISPALQQYIGMPKFALDNVKEALGLNEEGLSPAQLKDRDMLEAMAFDASPQESFRRRMLKRKNIPGFSLDGMRVYANYFARAARYVARMDYSSRLEESIREVRQSSSPVSKDTRTRIATYMERHYREQMNPAGDWAGVRSLGFMWYFAFVPSTAFVNLTQLPLVTGPFLASRFGDLATGQHGVQVVSRAMKDYFGKLKGEKIEPDAMSEAIDQAHVDRLLDDGFATELAAISNGSVLSRTVLGGKMSRGIRLLAQWGTMPFVWAEKVNRGITFRAAYQLALDNPQNPYVTNVVRENPAEAQRLKIDRGWDDVNIAAYLTAADSVRRTQFEYSRWSRPKVMQGKGGVILMFKSYLQNMLYFIAKQDRGTKGRMLLTLLAGAGLLGLPGADDANEITKWLARQLGYDIDPERAFRSFMVHYVNSDLGDVMLHGASRVGFGIPQALSGLGVPSPTLDMSGALSMGKLLPGLSALNKQDAGFNELLGNMHREMLGPILGVPLAIFQSLVDTSLPMDDPKRWERMMPRAARDASKAARYLAEGRERDRGGATIVQFDPNDMSDQMDALAVGLGFQPTKLSRQWDYIQATKEVETLYTLRRQLLAKEFFRAVRLKDSEGRADALEAIKDFNSNVPYPSMRITSDSLRRSITAQQRQLQLREAEIPQRKTLRPVRKEMEVLYPEVERRRVR